ncbi:MAG: TonB-dependent receptor [Steroidobacteraceae bacterium]
MLRYLPAAAVIAIAAWPVLAEEGPIEGESLDEVVVTSQRRAESLQRVPLAVSAFTADDLQSRQVTSAVDVANLVPNLLGQNNIGAGTANTYFMRGLGSVAQVALLDPAVSTYVDEVIIPRQNANNYAMFDVERLEVLRGPQGTTFGRNSTGGAISIVTRKPGYDRGGYLTVGAGEYDRRLVRASVDLPASDRILTKFSGFYVEDDGWLDNQANGETLNGGLNWGLRAATRFLPNDAVTWDLTAEYMVSEGVNLRSNLGDRDTTNTAYSTTGATSDLVADMLARRGLRNEAASLGLISNLEWRVGGETTFNSITGYRSLAQEFLVDFSLARANATPAPFALGIDGDFRMFSQEFKLTGPIGARLRYVAGVYGFYEDNNTQAGQATAASATAPPVMSCSNGLFGDGNVLCPNGRPGYASWRDIDNETKSFAVYAQFDWQLTDRVTAIAGARYTDETKEVDLKPTAYGSLTNANLVAAGIPTRLDTSLVTPKVGVNFQATDDVMLYASATRGFKAGGWNSQTAYRPQEFQPMEPEKTWSWETGFKSELFDRRLRVNATAFFAKTTGLQLSYTTPGPVAGTVLSTQDNAGDIEVRGVELEFSARITRDLFAYGSAGLQDGKYTSVNPAARSFCTNGGSVVNGACANPAPPATTTTYTNAIDPGDELSRFPERTFALGLDWGMPLAATGGTLRTTVEATWNSGFWTTASNSWPGLRLDPAGPLVTPNSLDTFADSYALLNISLAYESGDDQWRAALECRNCTDKAYLASVFNGEFYGEPRRVGATLSYRF